MSTAGVSQCVCLVTLLWSLVEVHSQTSTPYISFMGRTLDNHSYVDFNRVGRAGDGSDSVRCRSELVMCCSATHGNLSGDWFFPSGERLPFPGTGNDPFEGRGAQTVDLRRVSALTPSGIYRCDIAFDADDPSAKQTLYVGIYNNGGYIAIPNRVGFTLDSDLNGDSPQFTLTCISTGGPATTVTWTRDSITVTEGTETVLNNAVTAQYTHTLTVTGRQPGTYMCTVANNKSSSTSQPFTVQGPQPPTGLTFEIRSDSNSVALTWTPSSDATGYLISYSSGRGDSGTGNIAGGESSNFNLTDLRTGDTYTISIVATSVHFFSDSVQWDPVTLSQAPEPECGESGSSAVAAGLGGGLAVVIVIGAVIVVVLVIVIVILLRKLGRAKELLGEPPKTTKRNAGSFKTTGNEAYGVVEMTDETTPGDLYETIIDTPSTHTS